MLPRNAITAKTFRDHRRGTAWWTASVAAFVALEAAVYPTVRDQAGLQEMWQQLPDAMKAVFGFGDGTDLLTGAGFLQAELFGIMLPLAFIGFAISLGGRAIGREEERGTLDLLLAYPVKRARVVVEKHLAGVALTVVLGIAAFAALAAGNQLAHMHVRVVLLAAAMAGVVIVAVFFGALALLISCARPAKGVAYALAALAALATFLVNSLASMSDVVGVLRPLSPFRWAMGEEPLRTGFQVGMLVPLGGAALLVWAAAWAFGRRDVAG